MHSCSKVKQRPVVVKTPTTGIRLFILTLFIFAFSCSKPKYEKISIEYDCQFNPCPLVIIEKDSIYWIDQYSDKLLYKNKFNSNRIGKTIENLDTLSSSYINNYTDDGIQLNITLTGKNKEKKIYISNYYLSAIDSIITILNQRFPDSLKLEYPSDLLIKVTKDGLNKALIQIKK